MSKFIKEQPRDGEIITHCGHRNKPYHFFGFGEDLPSATFIRPDGSSFSSRWMVLCNMCFPKAFENPHSVIRADSIWVGDEPAIEENMQ